MVHLLQLIVWIVPLVLLIFWLRMFWDMTNNDDLPKCFITFTRGNDARFDWTVTFIFLSLFTAILYFFTEYRNRY
jgi:hypothetical protein